MGKDVLVYVLVGVLIGGSGGVFAAGEEVSTSVPTFTETLAEEMPRPKEPILLRLNLPATRLDLYINDQLVKSFPVAIGMARYPTPVQQFNISQIIWNPWWIPPDSDWARNASKTPPGPSNPLGVVKLMMENGIRIHGTNAPRLIGRAVSHACVRMHNKEARELAWEIQTRYSEKDDPVLLDKYQRNRRRSYYVNLFEAVPVIVDYQQVERHVDRLLLHPNRYWRRGFQQQLEEALADHPEIVLDQALVKKLDKMRRRKTVEVLLSDLQPKVPAPMLSKDQDAAKALSADP